MKWSFGVTLEIYQDIKSKAKTIDTRAPDINAGKILDIQIGDGIEFYAVDSRFRRVSARPILKFKAIFVRHYPTLNQLFRNEDFKKIFPRAKDVPEAICVYNNFPGYSERIRKHGIVAIGIR